MKRIIIIFLILITIQMAYSFIFNAHGTDDCWKSFETLSSYKGYSFTSTDNTIVSKVDNLLSNYRLNCDGAGYILLAQDFPNDYFEGRNIFLSRPLYSFLIYLVSLPLQLVSNSYALIFASAIFVNFVLFFFTVLLLYLVAKNFVSLRVAFLSSFLLIFSPFVHIRLVQPNPDIFGAFLVMLSLYLIYIYINFPSRFKLALFSLIIGTLLLGKMVFAISFFILILALYFKRYKEGLTFCALHLIPLGFWYILVTKIWGLDFHVDEVATYRVGVWLFDIVNWPWYKTVYIFLNGFSEFITAIIFAFLLIPLIFSVIGFSRLVLSKKNIIFGGFIFAFFLLLFAMDIYNPQYAFLIFPVIYPWTVLGIDRAVEYFKKQTFYSPTIFYLIIYIIILIISNVDIYKIVNYG